jgi:hypothetical protein
VIDRIVRKLAIPVALAACVGALAIARAHLDVLVYAGGVPGKFCTSENGTNWYGRSPKWDAEKSIRLSRS